MAKRKETTLFSFLKDNCANFYDTGCLFCVKCSREKNVGLCRSCFGFEPFMICLVWEGERCGYFEQRILNVPERSRLPRIDYARLSALYAQQTGAETRKVRQRRCPGSARRPDCGAPLGYRKRYCPDCSRDRAKAAIRQRQRNHRLQKVTV